MVQRARKRHDDAHERDDDRERNGAKRVVGKRVQYFRAGEDMESDEHNVVREEHERGEMVGPSLLAEGVVAKVADVHNLWVSRAGQSTVGRGGRLARTS